MTAPSTFFYARSDLSALISAANTVHPLSNADLRGVEPEMKSTIIGFDGNGDPIWRRVPVHRVRDGKGYRETYLPNTSKEELHERACAR